MRLMSILVVEVYALNSSVQCTAPRKLRWLEAATPLPLLSASLMFALGAKTAAQFALLSGAGGWVGACAHRGAAP